MNPRRSYQQTARADHAALTADRIVSSAMELLLELPYEDVTLVRIADAAGVSHQTVLNHFGSKEGVALAVAEIVRVETGAARAAAVPGDVRGAVGVLVGEYERIGDANARWAATSDRLGELARLLDDARAGHQQWLAEVFADQLHRDDHERSRAVHALHAATDVYTWKLLRRDLGLDRVETEQIMVDLVVGVLDGADT